MGRFTLLNAAVGVGWLLAPDEFCRRYVKAAWATVGIGALIGLVACSTIDTQVVDPLINDLAQINATALADLQTAESVADAATPPDTDGYNCAAAAIVVQGQIAQVAQAADVSTAGVLTAAELASLFQPGSDQYNEVKDELQNGCAAKAAEVLGAANVLAAGGVLAVLPELLPLASTS